MIDVKKIKDQILSNVSPEMIFSGREKATPMKIGMFGKAISNAVMASDIRMYRREVFVYNGKHYEYIDSAVFNKIIIDVMESLMLGYEFIVSHRAKVTSFCIDNLIEKDIKPERYIIPFNNCLLNTITMEQMNHSPSHDILYCLNYDYDKDAKCPKWEKFLAQVLPKQGLIEVLQEYLGLLFVDRDGLKLEKMLVLIGGGSNGKSVIFETIIRILGDQNVSTYDMASLTKAGTAEYNLASIDGKILNYSSELDPKDFSSEMTKKLISGEPVMARKIYSEPIMLKNIPLFILNANKLPETSDKTHGFFRRILPIPFDVTISEKNQDKSLSNKLRDEYAGILNWIIEGRRRILANKVQFSEVSDIDRVKEEYRMTQDSIYGFLKTNRFSFDGEDSEKRKVSDSDMYSNYVSYCQEVNKLAYGKLVFTNHIVSMGFKKYKEGDVRGVYVFCDRNPMLHWNKDIGNVYDGEIEIIEGEKEQEEWKEQTIPF